MHPVKFRTPFCDVRMFCIWFRIVIGDFGTNKCWNQTLGWNQKLRSISWSIRGSPIDQLIGWASCSVNSRLLDRSADRSSHILSQTEGPGIDHWIDWPVWIDQPIDPEYCPSTVACWIDHWIDPTYVPHTVAGWIDHWIDPTIPIDPWIDWEAWCQQETLS